jgi:hypothetical protein
MYNFVFFHKTTLCIWQQVFQKVTVMSGCQGPLLMRPVAAAVPD